MSLQKNLLRVVDLGHTDYKSCWEMQQKIVDDRQAGLIGDTLLLTEHNHVYTLGRSADPDHLLAGESELRQKGIAVYQNDRGGGVTYHGPGQLVGYPILDLTMRSCDLHRYLRDLEEVVMLTLAAFGLRGSRVEGYTGVWLGSSKVCAIGIKVQRWVTMHGFALNISPDLTFYRRIIPCGIFERGVTSMCEETGLNVERREVIFHLVRAFGAVFGVEVQETSPDDLTALLSQPSF
jgi:lipoyl(octanoyl) transferase